MSAPVLDSVPKGNTCHGVNRAIVEHLMSRGSASAGMAILDVPCGNGELVGVLRHFFPAARVQGGDLSLAPGAPEGCCVVDASRPFSVPGEKFDVICCVSGIMEFDNTLQFFESCRRHLAPNGLFIVTNDNVVSVRDRLAYLALGKTRRFELFGAPDQPTWKLVPLQNLLRILHDAGFAVRAIRYVSIRLKDWAMLPLALLLWPGQWLHANFARGPMPRARRTMMFPFRALLCRHYLVFCEAIP